MSDHFPGSIPVTFEISFGGCDPAGIVFYPDGFRWMDAAFHQLLRSFGGHAVLCERLDAIGLGVAASSIQFLRPMRDGDVLELTVDVAEWSRRSLTLTYEGTVNGALMFSGRETRCLFFQTDQGIVAGDLSELRALMEHWDV